MINVLQDNSLLSKQFLDSYQDAPEHMNELGNFVYYRTYSRWLPSKKRRENLKESVVRAVNYNIGIATEEFKKKGITPPFEELRMEAELLFDNIYNLRQFLSGRTHWVGGAETGVADKFPLANFNCSFLNINSWDDIGDLFYLLLVGTGVGFKCTKKMASNLPAIRNDIHVNHQEYEQVPKEDRVEDTYIIGNDDGHVYMVIGDSKEGWVSSLRLFFNILTEDKYKDVTSLDICYDNIRPNGERLETFGGTASGYEPLKEMFQGIMNVINGKYAPVSVRPDHRVEVRPIHILDIGNLVGNNVVVGGVRRTAEIFLSDDDDWEVILAKYGINGIWDDGEDAGDGKWMITKTAEEKHEEVLKALSKVVVVPEWFTNLKMNDKNARPLHHRRMSNNSVGFEKKPSRKMLNLLFTIMRNEGEPGFVNLEAAGKRRYNAEGLNPCAEILLDSYGVCNLTTVNVDAFVVKNSKGEWDIDIVGLLRAQRLSARAGVRMTCLDLEIPHWDEVHKRDRLIGPSLTGWRDAMEKLGFNDDQEENLLIMLSRAADQEAEKYAKQLRIPVPLLTTTVKPEGTLSQVAGGVSSGLHASHAPFYIRRIRINASDPLAKVAMELGWTVNPEVGQTWLNARTLVIDFPVASGASRTKDDVYIDEQFDRYFRFQEAYTSHNSSNTIHVRDNEWDRAEEIVWNRWDDFIGVSFLSHGNHSYELAPYETITEEQYLELKNSMKPFDPSLLDRWETDGLSELTDESCADGACAPR